MRVIQEKQLPCFSHKFKARKLLELPVVTYSIKKNSKNKSSSPGLTYQTRDSGYEIGITS
jgi:hypothetical protein